MASIINYEKAFVDFIKSNEFKVLPPQQLINENEEIATAVWNNFTIPIIQNAYTNDFTFEKWYKAGNWSVVLSHYKENIHFWENILDNPGSNYKILLYPEFQKEFPVIVNHYLNNNEKLQNILYKTENEDFFELINLPPEEKNQLYRFYRLEKKGSVPRDYIPTQEHDEKFVALLLSVNKDYYDSLNEVNRNNDKYIEIVLAPNKKYRDEGFNNLKHFPIEKRETVFPLWLVKYKDSIEVKHMKMFTQNESEMILKNKPTLLMSLLQHQHKQYGYIAHQFLQKDFLYYVEKIHIDGIKSLFPSSVEIQPFKKDIIKLIDSYIPKVKQTQLDKIMIYLCNLDPELEIHLSENIAFNIDNFINKEKEQHINTPNVRVTILESDFFNIIGKIILMFENGRINDTKATQCILRLKSHLPTESLKELKLPKDDQIFTYLTRMQLNKRLYKELPINSTIRPKMKI